MGYSGFDFLVVDMEHVPIEVSDLAHILRAVGCTPAGTAAIALNVSTHS